MKLGFGLALLCTCFYGRKLRVHYSKIAPHLYTKNIGELTLSFLWGIWLTLVADGPLLETSTSTEPVGTLK